MLHTWISGPEFHYMPAKRACSSVFGRFLSRKRRRASRRPFNRRLILARQRGRCLYCSQNIDRKFEIDHIMPLSWGGFDHLSNLQALCSPCHDLKSVFERSLVDPRFLYGGFRCGLTVTCDTSCDGTLGRKVLSVPCFTYLMKIELLRKSELSRVRNGLLTMLSAREWITSIRLG